jgi:hypothetical protein
MAKLLVGGGDGEKTARLTGAEVASKPEPPVATAVRE